MSVPAFLVGAGVVGAIMIATRKPGISSSGQGASAGGPAGNNATTGADNIPSTNGSQVSEPVVGVPTPSSPATGHDNGLRVTQFADPINPGQTVTTVDDGLGIQVQPTQVAPGPTGKGAGGSAGGITSTPTTPPPSVVPAPEGCCPGRTRALGRRDSLHAE
jgi:hypothetical protein